jgi:hypothetical protein
MEASDTAGKTHRAITSPDGPAPFAYCPCISTDNRFLTYVAGRRHDSWGTGDLDVYLQPLDAPKGPAVRLGAHPANDRWPHLYVGPLQVNIDHPPRAPEALTGQRQSDGRVLLSWRDGSDNESGFYLERRDGEGPFVQCLVLPPDTTGFILRDPAPSGACTFRVRATNLAGDSACSNEAGVRRWR